MTSKEWKAGKIKAVEFMDKAGMKKVKFYKKMREYEEIKSLKQYKWMLYF
ncbi:resolvase [Bacillus thuringiensis]|uniref:Resolvase n=1 Tax=Bacillus thuringiensis TaxID=1428 RepID=A0ABD6R517_BACTU|nr:resolvase [Bacillus thuringiensis]OTY03371.1 resolvase [Bacillus thuringiensis serovar kim]OUB14156.1 resolvase [Bacillus thuringiensis serovar xiaguangiensis]